MRDTTDYEGQMIFPPFNPLSDYTGRRDNAISRELAMLARGKTPTEQHKHTGGAWDGGAYTSFPEEEDLLARYERCMARLSKGADMLDISDVAAKLGQSVEAVRTLANQGKMPMFALCETEQEFIPDFAIAQKDDGSYAINTAAVKVCQMYFDDHTARKRWPDQYMTMMEREKVDVPAYVIALVAREQGADATTVKFLKESGLATQVSLPNALRATGHNPDLGTAVVAQIEDRLGLTWQREAANKGISQEILDVINAPVFDPSKLVACQPAWTNQNVHQGAPKPAQPKPQAV